VIGLYNNDVISLRRLLIGQLDYAGRQSSHQSDRLQDVDAFGLRDMHHDAGVQPVLTSGRCSDKRLQTFVGRPEWGSSRQS